MKKVLWLLVITITLFSCGSENEKNKSIYHEFSDNSWSIDQPVKCPFEITDTSGRYAISAKLRYNGAFTFSTLDLSITLMSPGGSSRSTKRNLSMRTKDGDKAGTAKGSYYELPFEVYKSAQFNETGEWTLVVEHNMPVDISGGLVGLEVNIEKMK